MDLVISRLVAATHFLVDGNKAKAREELLQIDLGAIRVGRDERYAAVWGGCGVGRLYKKPKTRVLREPVRASVIRDTFSRDSYCCRYQHCQRRTVSPKILRFLADAVPYLMPYHRNWRPVEAHILFWVYSTSLEHIVPFPAGGTSEASNLITSCYECNDTKNYLPIAELGWTVSPPCRSTWRGLAELEKSLKAVSANR